jgi:hypothetical protein
VAVGDHTVLDEAHLAPPRCKPWSRRRVRIIEQAAGSYVVATLGHYVIVLLKTYFGSRGIAALEAASEDVLRQYSRIGHLVVLYPEHNVPGPEEREAISRVLRRYRSAIAGAAIVREGDGFKATVTRSVGNAIQLLSRASHPMRIFPDVGDASVWLGSHLPGADVDATNLRAAVRELRTSFA